MSGLTPPVCGAAYAASVIAKAVMFATAFESLKLAVGGFLVPFVFICNPGLLGIEGPGVALLAFTTGCLRAFLLASGAGTGTGC
jgi:TRAP-type uncharacterized transport system fused permease subunit